jgi:hypothetical protein
MCDHLFYGLLVRFAVFPQSASLFQRKLALNIFTSVGRDDSGKTHPRTLVTTEAVPSRRTQHSLPSAVLSFNFSFGTIPRIAFAPDRISIKKALSRQINY